MNHDKTGLLGVNSSKALGLLDQNPEPEIDR